MTGLHLRHRVVLASRSPRRVELLARIGIAAEVAPADVDETPLVGETPVDHVRRLAACKAMTVARSGVLTIAADTTIDLDGEIVGQPTDAAEALAMLTRLSGRSHRVHTGVAVVSPTGRMATDVVTSVVTMQTIDAALREWYVSTGEPFGKAGGYALQGRGGVLVERVLGSHSNVVGLPMREALALLRAADHDDD